jgi:hypothetical protein
MNLRWSENEISTAAKGLFPNVTARLCIPRQHSMPALICTSVIGVRWGKRCGAISRAALEVSAASEAMLRECGCGDFKFRYVYL